MTQVNQTNVNPNETLEQKIDRENRERIDQVTAPIRAKMEADKQAAEAAKAKAAADKIEADRQAKEATMKADAQRKFLAAGGTLAGFSAAWPSIQQALLIQAATAPGDPIEERQRKAELRRQTQNGF